MQLKAEFENAMSQLNEMEIRIKTLEARALSLGGFSFIGILISVISLFLTNNKDADTITFILIAIFPILIVSQIFLILTFLRSPNFFAKQIYPLDLNDSKLTPIIQEYKNTYLKYVELYNIKSFYSKWGGSFLITFIISSAISIYFIVFFDSVLKDIWFALFWLVISILFALYFKKIFKSFEVPIH